jgi:ferritin-like metal-binding protein YciE
MGFFSNKSFGSLEDLFVEQIEDLYDAETRLTKALPKMAEAAERAELRDAFNKHLRETEVHVERLERIFKQLGREPRREACDGIKGLIAEGNEMISADGDATAKDAGLIAAAQRVEHYEIAGYGTARAIAEHLGHNDAVRLLQTTLDEEGATDKKLTEIAEASIYGKKSSSKLSRKAASTNGHKTSKARTSRSTNGHKKTTKAKTATRARKSPGRKKAASSSR